MAAKLRGTGVSEIPSLDLTTPLAVVDGGTGVSTVKPYRMVLGTAIATTSGTSHDFTGIPAWVKRITVILSGVSTNGVSVPIIQIGDSGGIEATGYVSTSNYTGNSVAGPGFYSTIGMTIASASGTNTLRAVMTFHNIGSNLWVSSLSGGFEQVAVPVAISGGGDKTLSGTLDRIRLTTINGTDVFDGGSFNAVYEGYED